MSLNQIKFFRKNGSHFWWQLGANENLVGITLDLEKDEGAIEIEVGGFRYSIRYERGSLGPATPFRSDAPKLPDGFAKMWNVK